MITVYAQLLNGNGISSRIYIDDDYSVTIASLWKELIPLVKKLSCISTNNNVKVR